MGGLKSDGCDKGSTVNLKNIYSSASYVLRYTKAFSRACNKFVVVAGKAFFLSFLMLNDGTLFSFS